MAKNNDQILNELFFKKKSYSDSVKDKQAQYSPVKKTDDVKNLFAGNSEDGFIISDPNAVKERLVGALGMAMGSHTVRSMANKAIKNFPIIVSDDISPETLVIVKTMMEEQYASYIDLLVSNQIINIADYDTSDTTEGNIAIQALNKIDGTDFGRSRIARKAQTGSLSIDDIMQNNPGWQFLRANEELKYVSGNPILDELLENAIIVPSTEVKPLLESIYAINEMEVLNEGDIITANLPDDITNGSTLPTLDSIKTIVSFKPASKHEYLKDKKTGRTWRWVNNTPGALYYTAVDDTTGHFLKIFDGSENRRSSLDSVYNTLIHNNSTQEFNSHGMLSRNDADTDSYRHEFTKLVSPGVFSIKNNLDNSLDRSVADYLYGKQDANDKKGAEMREAIRDRFEKASFLLASEKISGSEYISYIVDRLGLPISDKVRVDITTKYPFVSTKFDGDTRVIDNSFVETNDPTVLAFVEGKLNKNSKAVIGYVNNIASINIKDIGKILLSGGTAMGAGAAAGIALGLSNPILGIVMAGSAAVGGLAYLIYKLFKNRKLRKLTPNYTGWERVEILINKMDASREDLLSGLKLKAKKDDEVEKDNTKSINDLFIDFKQQMTDSLERVARSNSNNIVNLKGYSMGLSESVMLDNAYDFCQQLDEEIMQDEKIYSEWIALDESAKYIINTKKPGDVIVKQTKYDAKEVANMVPAFGTRDTVAYGSVEFDRRDIKDRKFNEPLILTIKFKERYSDGKYNDNELTAVIGILGVVTRVPSSEMATVLKSNIDGKILSIFKADEDNKSSSLIGNVISNFMNSKYSKTLPTSGKVWANLEKVTALAVANKLAGKNNGNISNAHLVFSQKEVDLVKNETGVDYLKNAKITAQLMKKYSAFMIAVCNDGMRYLYTFNNPDAISWEDAPYSAYIGKNSSDQLVAALTQVSRGML